jgi:methylase of polypeptide subunit release factors
MELGEVSRLRRRDAAELGRLLRELGIQHAYIRAHTERLDNLRVPLIATRQVVVHDDAPSRALRLFFCGETLRRDDAAEAIGSGLVADLIHSGVLEEDLGRVRFPFHLRTAAGLYIQSDYLGEHPDGVMGAGETTAILYRAARPSKRIRRVLDLGCGAGTLALLLAQQSDFAIGTDINARAVILSQWNSWLNGIENVEFRTGSLYEPVAGERFDLIVSQPPYYPNAGPHLTFLHGGVRGDELAQQVVNGVPEHVTAGGRAMVFTSWPLDAPLKELPGFESLEMCTNRRELHETRQSLNVFCHTTGPACGQRFVVPADCWGGMEGWRIEQILRTRQWLQSVERPAASFGASTVERTFEEGDGFFVQFEAGTLLGVVAMEERLWRVIQAPAEANPKDLDEALDRGFLYVRGN